MVLLVPHKITTFFTDDGKDKLMARHRAFLTRPPLMPKFNVFIGAKYLFHTWRIYLALLQQNLLVEEY